MALLRQFLAPTRHGHTVSVHPLLLDDGKGRRSLSRPRSSVWTPLDRREQVCDAPSGGGCISPPVFSSRAHFSFSPWFFFSLLPPAHRPAASFVFSPLIKSISVMLRSACCSAVAGAAESPRRLSPAGCFTGGGNLLWTCQQSWKVKLKCPPPVTSLRGQ